MADTVTAGLLVRTEAIPGREAEVESFLEGGLSLVNEETDTMLRGTRSGWDPRRSASSTPSRTTLGGKRISRARSLRR